MLKIENLTYSYDGKNNILNKINLHIHTGEFIALAGPNGCGKTTLIKLMTDLLKLQTGKITFEDKKHSNKFVKTNIVYLPSDDYLPEFLTGREYVDLYAQIYNCNYQENQLTKLVKYYSMSNNLEQLIEDYSHGMRKKIQLISAFLINPKLIIIDETLNGIDVEAMEVSKLLMRQFKKNGGTIILCTHDLPLAEELSERVLLMYQGEIKFDESTLYLGHKYEKTLIELFNETIDYKRVADEISSDF